ncbi:hypothetical protein D3C86_2238710 [compost metagenome]
MAIQENTCTPLGIATAKLATDVTCSASGPSPAVNMWCIHSKKLIAPTATSAQTIAR